MDAVLNLLEVGETISVDNLCFRAASNHVGAGAAYVLNMANQLVAEHKFQKSGQSYTRIE